MTLTGVKKLFVDTNVLIFATNSASPWHLPASNVLQEARRLGVELVISPQIIREYLVAATRPGSSTVLPLAAVLTNVRIFQTDFHLVEDNALVSAKLIDLVSRVTVGGKQIHDANVVAPMQIHNISHLLTHNVADFTRFAHLITVLPLLVGP
ncbi:MAG: type II toxin-antitoxin system VapC family toxin [Anaerolineae bacterium]|nr:VapC toxin family PIN domain ribonuclease [Anaerolineales bacterium]MCQ3977697.1 VapC toxin family PIN domain ribonuclease [Anaerolineae bacterium]